jgi:hypothetical protein
LWCQNGVKLSPENQGVFQALERGGNLKNSGKLSPENQGVFQALERGGNLKNSGILQRSLIDKFTKL